MKRLIKAAPVLAALAVFFSAPAAAVEKGIYGEDDRLDYFEASPEMRNLADSVVSFWKSGDVEKNGSKVLLNTVNFGEVAGLCQDEPFRDQPVGAFCSGSLVGEDLVMTAGHCVTDETQCSDTRVAFGYALKRQADPAQATRVPASEVYSCRRIIKRDMDEGSGLTAVASQILDATGPDYALIQLDRKVTGHRPLPIHRNGKIKEGEQVFVIGHPVGLPLKVAGAGRVRSSKIFRSHFTTDLDTYGGNSGSPVFNLRTKLIEGILVRGGTDFVKAPEGCLRSAKVGQNEGKGEAATHVSKLEDYIPVPGRTAAQPKLLDLDQAEMRFEPLELAVNFD